MERTKILLSNLILISAVLIISSCRTLISAETARSIYTQIEVGVTYGKEVCEGYRFTPPTSGRYIINVIGTDSDVNWILCDGPKARIWQIIVIHTNDDTIDRTPVLNAGQEYYLWVDKDKKPLGLCIMPE